MLLSRPAAAGDVDAYFTVFDNTCAHSLSTPERFAAAAQAAGLQFIGALSNSSEAETEHTWHDTAYWAVDRQPHALTVSMTVSGSAAAHRLSCIVRPPAEATLTLEAAVAHVRAAMGLGEPTSVNSDGSAVSGARWEVGAQIVGIEASPDTGTAISIAVITEGKGP